jgi:hypothetical protein
MIEASAYGQSAHLPELFLRDIGTLSGTDRLNPGGYRLVALVALVTLLNPGYAVAQVALHPDVHSSCQCCVMAATFAEHLVAFLG